MSVLKRCSAVCLVLLSGIAAQGKDAGQEELPPAETDISNPVMFRLRMNRFFARVGPFARWIPTGKGKHTVCIVKQEKDGLVLTLAGRSPELPRQAVGTFWKAACFEFSVPVSFLGKKLQFECRVSGPVETLSICGKSHSRNDCKVYLTVIIK